MKILSYNGSHFLNGKKLGCMPMFNERQNFSCQYFNEHISICNQVLLFYFDIENENYIFPKKFD